jgi:hypothetical protein
MTSFLLMARDYIPFQTFLVAYPLANKVVITIYLSSPYAREKTNLGLMMDDWRARMIFHLAFHCVVSEAKLFAPKHRPLSKYLHYSLHGSCNCSSSKFCAPRLRLNFQHNLVSISCLKWLLTFTITFWILNA